MNKKRLVISRLSVVGIGVSILLISSVPQAQAGQISATSLMQGQKTVEIRSARYPSKCLDVQYGNTANQTPVQTYDCLNNAYQKFTVKPYNSTYLMIQYNGKCVDVKWGAAANGTKVWLWDCTGNGAQLWQPLNGNVFRNQMTGKCLDSEYATNGFQVKIWDCNGLDYQQWIINDLTPATPTPTKVPPTPTPIPQATNTPYPTPTPIPNATNTPIPTPTPTKVPSATVVGLTLQLHGLGNGGDAISTASTGNFYPKRPTRPVTLYIYDANNNQIATKQGTIVYDQLTGHFKGTVDLGTNLPSGAYTIRVKADQFLRSQVPGIAVLNAGSTNNLTAVPMTNGDVNDDNAINIKDYNALMGCYSDLRAPVACMSGYQVKTDLNDDGAVNQFDYNLFMRELTNIAGV